MLSNTVCTCSCATLALDLCAVISAAVFTSNTAKLFLIASTTSVGVNALPMSACSCLTTVNSTCCWLLAVSVIVPASTVLSTDTSADNVAQLPLSSK